MSLDITTLRLLKYRSRYDKLVRGIPKRALDVRTQIILADMGRWFAEFPDAAQIDAHAFNIFFKMVHPELTDEARAVYDQLLSSTFSGEVPQELEAGLMRRLTAAATAHDALGLIEKYNAGAEVDLRAGIALLLDEYDAQVKSQAKDPQVRDPIEELLAEDANDFGFHFRLACLNRHIKPLVPGDFIVVAARPDKGKTTWAASELTFMAAQVDKLYPGENRSILWFNNEGPGRRIVKRTFQSALGCTMEELAKKSESGTIRQEYIEAIGGRGGALRIFDIHGYWSHQVEELLAAHRPAICLWDMIDNVRFGGGAVNGGERTDQLLESMYGWVRMMGVKYDCVMIAMSQISADGDGLQYPTQPMLKDSKTGKQGAADVIITLGASNDPMLSDLRYIGCTKSKKVRTGMPMSPQTAVRFNGDRARYEDIE